MKAAARAFVGITACFILVCAGIFLFRNYPGSMRNQQLSTEKGKEELLGLIDLNTANMEQLMLLPGIGETLARRIIEYRENVGPFAQLEDLLNIKGIGESVIAEIQDYIMIGE